MATNGNSNKEFVLDQNTPLESVENVHGLLAVTKDGTGGAVSLESIANEAGKKVGEAVKVTGTELPTLGTANKTVTIYGGDNGKIMTYNGAALPAIAKDCVSTWFWDGTAETWEKIDEVKSKGDSGTNGQDGQGLLPLFESDKAGGYMKDAQVRDINGVTYVSLKDANTSALSVAADWKSTGTKLDVEGGAASYEKLEDILNNLYKGGDFNESAFTNVGADNKGDIITLGDWRYAKIIVKKGQIVTATVATDAFNAPAINLFDTNGVFISSVPFANNNNELLDSVMNVSSDGYVTVNTRIGSQSSGFKVSITDSKIYLSPSDLDDTVASVDELNKKTSILETLNYSKKLFSIRGRLNENGWIEPAFDWLCTSGIKLEKGEKLYFRSATFDAAAIVASVFNENGSLVKNILNTGNIDNYAHDYLYIAEDNCIVIINTRTSNTLYNYGYGVVDPYPLKLSENDVSKTVASKSDLSDLIDNKRGKYIDYSKFNFIDGDWHSTDFIELDAGARVIAKVASDAIGQVAIAVFDENRNPLDNESVPFSAAGALTTVKYTSNAKRLIYVRNRNATANSGANVSIEYGTILSTEDFKKNNRYVKIERPNFARLNLQGSFPTDISGNTSTNMRLSIFCDGVLKFKSACKVSIQGQSTAGTAKPNYSIDLVTDSGQSIDLKIGNMVATDSFHLKAFYYDDTKVRDVVSGKIWRDMMNDIGYPECRLFSSNPYSGNATSSIKELYDNDSQFFADGVPTEVYYRDEFLGVYILRLKKKRENYGINRDNPNHILMDSVDYTAFFDQPFSNTSWGLKSPKIAGYTEGGPITDQNVLSKIERLWSFTTNLAANAAVANDYILLKNWVSTVILWEVIGHWDTNGNNQVILTRDGVHWVLTSYDMDNTYGIKTANLTLTEVPANSMILEGFWTTFKNVFSAQIREQYTAHRKSGFLTTSNLGRYFQTFMSNIDINAYSQDLSKWGAQLNKFSTMEQVIAYIDYRLKYLDTQWLNPLQSPNALNISLNDATTRVPYVMNGAFVSGGVQLSRAAIANNGAIRTNTGQLKAAPAVDSDDLPTFSQVSGIVNNALTATQTSAQLNSLYPTAAIGSVYKSITNSVEYTKISVTQWKKETLAIV